ncbi:hypothetical protein R1flu_027632 [Riccia fluitans]|uniref:Uncharacterized protein n=1 Tax=Riccia fluitans TaxID=41844 RepID=A0ABD1XJW9_9MARC
MSQDESQDEPRDESQVHCQETPSPRGQEMFPLTLQSNPMPIPTIPKEDCSPSDQDEARPEDILVLQQFRSSMPFLDELEKQHNQPSSFKFDIVRELGAMMVNISQKQLLEESPSQAKLLCDHLNRLLKDKNHRHVRQLKDDESSGVHILNLK